MLRFLSTFLVAIAFAIGATTTSAQQSDTTSDQQAGSAEHNFNLAKQYYGECEATSSSEFDNIRPYLKAFTDISVMAETMADPMKFAQLVSIVNDPRTIHVMSKCATEPVMWDTWMRGMSDWPKMMNAMGRMMNPTVAMNWMMAPMNPAMYQPMMKMMQPDYYGRWTTAMMNPAFYQPMYSMADPNWYGPRMAWMMNPNSFAPMFNGFAMPGTPMPAAPGADTQN